MILKFFLMLIVVAVAVAMVVRLVAWLARPRREHIGDSSGTMDSSDSGSSGGIDISMSRSSRDKHDSDGHDSGPDSGGDGGGD
ncbi:MAG: hypothetical protein RQ867_09170 [Mariprofundaceae bacterium]|nr:hypothetical protein [Mariprofundaceae bacterium]